MEHCLRVAVCMQIHIKCVRGIHATISLAADDQALRIWNIREKRHLQTIQDKFDRWGQVTCLKWLSINSPEGKTICFGTGRGLILVYQGGRDLVSELGHSRSSL